MPLRNAISEFLKNDRERKRKRSWFGEEFKPDTGIGRERTGFGEEFVSDIGERKEPTYREGGGDWREILSRRKRKPTYREGMDYKNSPKLK